MLGRPCRLLTRRFPACFRDLRPRQDQLTFKPHVFEHPRPRIVADKTLLITCAMRRYMQSRQPLLCTPLSPAYACRIHHDTRHLQECTADLGLDSSSISPPCTLWPSHLRRVQACTALRGKSKPPAVTLLRLVPTSHSSLCRARRLTLAVSSGSYRFHLAISGPRSSLEVCVRHATRARG